MPGPAIMGGPFPLGRRDLLGKEYVLGGDVIPVWTRNRVFKIDFLTSDDVFFFFSTGDDVGEGENVREGERNGLGRFWLFFLPPSAVSMGETVGISNAGAT